MLTAIFILLCLLAAGNAAVLMLLMRGRSAQGGVRAAGAANAGAAGGHAEAVPAETDADDDRAEKAFLESLSSCLRITPEGLA